VHERRVMEDLVGAVERIAGGSRPVGLRVRLGELSHFTPEHFVEHLQDTPLAGVEVEFGDPLPPTDPRSQSVLLESIRVEP
jgi:hydrogenase nickel incorporation protein HypA/HybF